MTESEAIEWQKSFKKTYKSFPKDIDDACDMAINALEKQIAKKPMFNGTNWYRCVNGCEIHKKQFEKDLYCPKCGQKLDFGE